MARDFYQGKYKVINTRKYLGDYNDVNYRSRWELLAFKFCDLSKDIKFWNSEEIIIPYVCMTDGKLHNYHVDLFLQWKNDVKVLVEIKPEKDAKPSNKKKGRNPNTVFNEDMVYLKNKSKWIAAETFAKDRKMIFQVWTEKALESLGINIKMKGM